MNNQRASFETLDLGSSQPTSLPMERIEVIVSPDGYLGDYAKAFVNEAQRVNPHRYAQVQLTHEEMQKYCAYLLYKRVQCIEGTCTDFRRLKVLYIPSYLQYALSMIGTVQDRDFGLELVPVSEGDCPLTLDEAMIISAKIGLFQDDLQVLQDAMPRGFSGNHDVMSTALIAGYVRSYRKVSHPAATYVSVLLDMQLRKDTAMQALYRIQYDDVAFIQSALSAHHEIFQ